MAEQPHSWQTPNALDGPRRGWRRSFMIALSIHACIGAWLLSHVVPDPPTDVLPRIEPVLVAAIESESKSPKPLKQPPMAPPAEAPDEGFSLGSLEPTLNDIRGGLTEALSQVAIGTDVADAFSRLTDQAQILEQISNPQEVGRIATKITEAMGMQAWPDGATSRPTHTGPFDFNKALLLDITREENGDTVTIREVMGTRDGARAVIESSRRITDAGPRFEQRLIEPDQTGTTSATVVSMDAEDFAAVESRQKPYELIRQFPLVQQLHRAAVLPLIEKLANESPDAGVAKP